MAPISLNVDERLDDLLTHQLKIIQSTEVFSFSMDAVLLARFCSVPTRGKVLDLCTGNAVIPLLLTTRTKARITAVEIQPRLVDIAMRNVIINELLQQIEIIEADLKTFHLQAGHGAYDLITVNPPYLPVDAGVQNVNEHIAIARHEIHCTLEDVIAACSRLVRAKGKVAMVHKPSRLAEICSIMRQYRIEPKRLRFVHPRRGEPANMVLIEGMKDGKPEAAILPPLIVFEANNTYCKELEDMYYPEDSRG